MSRIFSQLMKDNKIVNILFYSWLLTLPFGANILPISLGVFTLYPNLIFAICLTSLTVFSFHRYTKLMKGLSIFLLLWVLFAISYLFFNQKNEPAIFDIRSLIMQLIFALSLFNSYALLSKEKFYKILLNGLWSFFFVVLSFGLFEFLTGIHFSGTTTAKMEVLPASVIYYTPLFVYDNPNDYVLYLFGITSFLFLFDSRLQHNGYKIALLLLINYLFMYTSDARLGRYSMYLIIVVFSLRLIYLNKEKLLKINYFPFWGVLIMSIILIWSKPLFMDIKNGKIPNRIYEYKFVTHKDNHLEEETLTKVMSDEEIKAFFHHQDSISQLETSVNIRENLIRNGFDFIKEQPIFGIGPGQFRQRHIEGNVKHNTSTVTNPHNYPIEIISNYGIIAWIYFIIVGYIFFQMLYFTKFKSSENYFWIFTCFILLTPVFWLLPSSFLYLDINWLFLPLLIILLTQFKEKNIENGCK